MRTSNFITVSTILRSPYQLVYALPLLFISIALLFAGTFLTLDRTRSFASTPDVKKKAPFYRLGSGVGGLAIGWALGAHLSCLVSLLVLNQTETARLSPPAFLVVWLFSSVPLALVCGRWKYVSLALGGILGGACAGLILSISLHPSLLVRLILTLIFIVPLTVGTLLPYPRIQNISLRIGTSAAGAAGIINACAILGSTATNTKLASWGNAWLHFILLHDSDSAELQWGTGKAKGLTAAAYFLWMIGAACDWWLKRRVGEDPDEAWDKTLGAYAATFPPESSRTGTFTPAKPFWERIADKLHFPVPAPSAEKPLLFPSASELSKSTTAIRPGAKAPPLFRPNVPGSFAANRYDSDSDSDAGEGEKQRRPLGERKWTTSTNHSDTTLVSPRPEKVRKYRTVGGAFQPPVLSPSPGNGPVQYGDKDAERSPELNLGSHRIEPSKEDDKRWKPLFLKRSDSIKSTEAEIVGVGLDESQDITSMNDRIRTPILPGSRSPMSSSTGTLNFSGPSSRDRSTPRTALGGHAEVYAPGPIQMPTPGLVPATPSLIQAMDRVSRAQRVAYAGVNTSQSSGGHRYPKARQQETPISDTANEGTQGLPNTRERGEEHRWKGFWADVHKRAGEP
ncbi:hypothetical protein BDV93DRAFT_546432 [Ceratobasidium sp. AG-I]|nr:hypothetical protein BDV93DRAFT_529740 [Ceratobasidium sp. AG-I]KAF8600210.1 hypothetical protein BDV93DRAFT_546432 [Ceratobasidium sp. AG-I]